MMTINAKKSMVIGVIRRLEDSLCALKYCDYDGIKSFGERDAEIEVLQTQLRRSHAALVELTEEELKKVA